MAAPKDSAKNESTHKKHEKPTGYKIGGNNMNAGRSGQYAYGVSSSVFAFPVFLNKYALDLPTQFFILFLTVTSMLIVHRLRAYI
jgi:hypothetical protein